MKRTFRNKVSVSIQPAFWVILVFAVILLPLRWVVAWLIAVTLHELGHVLGAMLMGVSVYAVSVKSSGVYMQTSQMLQWQEIVVAVMGPLVGGIPIMFSRWMPYIASCAIVQLVFNMLPIIEFDGGRVLYGILKLFLSPVNANRCMNGIQVLLQILILLLGLYMQWSILAGLGAVMLLLRIVHITFPCKQQKQIVQWSK